LSRAVSVNADHGYFVSDMSRSRSAIDTQTCPERRPLDSSCGYVSVDHPRSSRAAVNITQTDICTTPTTRVDDLSTPISKTHSLQIQNELVCGRQSQRLLKVIRDGNISNTTQTSRQ